MPICANPPDSSSSSSSGSRVWISHLTVLGVAIAASAGVHFFLRRRSGKFRSRVVGIIPARFASSRFEGKPLYLILSKSMIHVSILLISLLVATDDEKIAECCRGFLC
ncbi:3-deoxy-manno-octulosonate cytidylyltransferase-like [Zingiber officinale]|uniref:3-deoxy-manno-octulosonate cytidylyltransferase-like n=1 Tax=Zingiber officinale TaxID=94328 RepID=UPI001C4D511A|nr:3-deoxy-manno-octulosonate cytidylyltransferase-like [Zingiber officinale]